MVPELLIVRKLHLGELTDAWQDPGHAPSRESMVHFIMGRIFNQREIVWLRLWVAAVFVFALLVTTAILGIYYFKFGQFYRYFARLADTRATRHLVPFVPLFALTFPALSAISSPVPAMLTVVAWFVVGLLFVELYSTGLYLRSMQTSEPEVPAPVLWKPSWRTKRDSDIRLHRLFEVHLIYVITPALVAAITSWNEPAPAILSALFLLRYFAFAVDFYDFEAIVHWHMHTRSMTVMEKPGVSGMINILMNYIVGPINGYVPRLYEIEHLRIHHRYDSGPGDPYSPMPYRRTSLIEFSWFAMLVITSDLIAWAQITGRRLSGRWRRTAVLNLFGYWLVVFILIAFERPLGALLVLFALLHGLDQAKSQYKWHGLPDPDNAEHPLSNTILWVPSKVSWQSIAALPVEGKARGGAGHSVVRDWTYFDNYHLIHHLYPSAHFDRYVDLLKRRAQDIIAAQGIVMTLSVIATSAFSMWAGDIDLLADALLTGPADGAAKREFIRRRLEPVPQLRHPQHAVFESSPVRRADRYLVRVLGAIAKAATPPS
jgi:hypothetical protein